MIGRLTGGTAVSGMAALAALTLIPASALAAPARAMGGSQAAEDVVADSDRAPDQPDTAPETVIGADEPAAVPGQDPFYCGERKLGTWF